jgi:hypothetical protein
MKLVEYFKNMSLERKATFSLMGLGVFVMIIITVYFSLQQRNQIYSELEKRGELLAQTLANSCEYGVLVGDEEALKENIAYIEEKFDIAYIIIQDSRRSVMAKTERGVESEALIGDVNKNANEATDIVVTKWKPHGQSSMYDIAVPIMASGETSRQTPELELFDEGEDALFAEPAPVEPVATGKIGIARVGLSLAGASTAVRNVTITTAIVMVLVLAFILFITSLTMRSLITPTRDLLENINASSTQILAAAEEQSTASVEQSTALAETSTTVEELAATAAEISNNAGTVVSIADMTFQSMDAIKASTGHSAKRILTLGEKSQSIGEIVGVIDDITRQTNLLALNASIEAARAGEAGKGFAVVATEIRKLANNVGGSTKQIKEIIKEIQDATNASILATEEVGKTVEKGVGLSQETTETAKQISLATQQQRSASEQTVKTIKEMTTVSKQVADSAQDTTKAIKELIKLSSTIKKILGSK